MFRYLDKMYKIEWKYFGVLRTVFLQFCISLALSGSGGQICSDSRVACLAKVLHKFASGVKE